MPSDVALELARVLSHYDLGELADLERNERGFVNTAFAIETTKGSVRRRYFLRKYRRGIQERELQFEHSLIDHLVSSRACPVAHIYKTREGGSYFHGFEGPDDTQGAFYAIFDFLPGEDRYTWVGPDCSRRELESSAVVLAEFHSAASGFAPRGRRVEPRILELLPAIAAAWAACPGNSKDTAFDAYLEDHLEQVERDIGATLAALKEPDARRLPETVIHCDYHPGNLKFQGDQVTGLFDFDWSKRDLRSFDVGLATWYFCTSWEGAQDGQLRLEEAGVFLRAYQSQLRGKAGLGPLSPAEIRYLPDLINAGNLYVLNWTILDFYAKEVDPQEYLVYLKHSVNFTSWFESAGTRQELEKMLSGV